MCVRLLYLGDLVQHLFARLRLTAQKGSDLSARPALLTDSRTRPTVNLHALALSKVNLHIIPSPTVILHAVTPGVILTCDTA